MSNNEQSLMKEEEATVEMHEVTDDGVMLEDGVYSPSEVRSQGKASVGSTVINMMCNVIGGGVLALPTAFHDSSMVVGLIMLFGTTCLTTLNLYFIVECAEFTHIYSYRLLLSRGLGHHLARVVDFSLFVFPFGALITYCRVIADAMPPVMEHVFQAEGFWLNEMCWLLIGGVFFFALSCRRSLEELKLSSIFGLMTIFYAGFLIIFRFFDGSYNKEGRTAAVADDFEAFYFKKDLFKTIPIISFSLSVHNNAPSYYEELKDRPRGHRGHLRPHRRLRPPHLRQPDRRGQGRYPRRVRPHGPAHELGAPADVHPLRLRLPHPANGSPPRV